LTEATEESFVFKNIVDEHAILFHVEVASRLVNVVYQLAALGVDRHRLEFIHKAHMLFKLIVLLKSVLLERQHDKTDNVVQENPSFFSTEGLVQRRIYLFGFFKLFHVLVAHR
jgi:hypothetical protein